MHTHKVPSNASWNMDGICLLKGFFYKNIFVFEYLYLFYAQASLWSSSLQNFLRPRRLLTKPLLVIHCLGLTLQFCSHKLWGFFVWLNCLITFGFFKAIFEEWLFLRARTGYYNILGKLFRLLITACYLEMTTIFILLIKLAYWFLTKEKGLFILFIVYMPFCCALCYK